MKYRILVVEDEPSMRLGISHFLASSGFAVQTCSNGSEGIAALGKGAFEVIITDLRLPGHDGLSILKQAKALSPGTGVIIMTAYADVKTAVQAIKEGAFDYIAKPFSNEELLIVIERFLKFRTLEMEVTRLRDCVKEKTGFENLIGVSSPMRDVFDRIASIADTDVPVLIQGESGTGKELVADAVHRLSLRNQGPFIKINCAAIPESLFESELFGYEKGAFTGAVESRKGKFEAADGGSIFFDEIADMPLTLQAKLLRVIEDNSVTRLGGKGPVKVGVRGIYATSKNLRDCIKTGTFREDLFYRINVVPIVVPPLRKRADDIPRLVDHFIETFGEKYAKKDLKVSPSAYEALLSYHYPGNVRELKHAVERAVLLSKNGVIEVMDLPDEISSAAKAETVLPAGNTHLLEGTTSLERQMIITALRETNGKRMEAARRLGISRKVLWKKIRDYNIDKLPPGNTE